MSNFMIKLDKKRPYRYVFPARLWDSKYLRFGDPFDVLLDTGSYNTVIHQEMVVKHGRMLSMKMKTSIGGFRGDANLCILHKIKIGDLEIEKVVALAVPFTGELKDHILLGANVTNNWKFAVSRKENMMEITEQLPDNVPNKDFSYRWCFDNKGKILAFQGLD